MPYVAIEVEKDVYLIRWRDVVPWARIADVPMLERGGRDTREWVSALRALGEGERASFRTMAVPRERLWSVVEDGSTRVIDRAAAAIAIAGSDAARILSVRAACPFPALRTLFERLARGEGDRAVAKALEDVERAGDTPFNPSSGGASGRAA